MSGYLVDTSVFIAAEQGRPLGSPPEGQARISVVTLSELLLGVHRAKGESLRQLREATVARARSFVALAYDEPSAEQFASLVARMPEGRRRSMAMDALIAATAIAHDLAVWTADADFAVLAEFEPRLIVAGP